VKKILFHIQQRWLLLHNAVSFTDTSLDRPAYFHARKIEYSGVTVLVT